MTLLPHQLVLVLYLRHLSLQSRQEQQVSGGPLRCDCETFSSTVSPSFPLLLLLQVLRILLKERNALRPKPYSLQYERREPQ